MLKYLVLLMGALAVLVASSEAEARGFRRSRGSCPNGQCYAAIPAATDPVATNSEADAAVVEAPVTPAVEAPAATVTSNVAASYTVARSTNRLTRGVRFFRRR